MEKLLKQFHLITHPRYNYNILHVFFAIYTIKKAQEIAISNDQQYQSNSKFSPLISLIYYCFVVTSITYTQLILLIILIFILNCIILGLLFILLIKQNPPTVISIILQQLFFYYHQILTMPIIYISLMFIYDDNICNTSDICSSQGYIILIIVSIINFLVSLAITGVLLYFGRCEQLMEDNSIYTLDETIIIKVIYQALQLINLFFKVIGSLQQLRFALTITSNLIFIIVNIRKNNYLGYLIIETIFTIINISINLKVSIYELFLVFTLMITLLIQVQQYFMQFYLTTKNQSNFSSIQNLEYFNVQGDKRSKIIISIFQINHKCLKCKSSQSIPECLLRKMSNLQNKKCINTLVYCNYISNHAPLKALIKLILSQANDIYFKQSFNNLSNQLYLRAKQYQKEAMHKNTVRSANEHQSSLNVQSAYMTSHSQYILFPILIETIQSKINFWSKLINGYQDIDHYLSETLKTTQKMLQCKKEVEKRFDMVNNKLKFQAQSDILTLRIIQIYYSGIYSNAFQAYQIEKSIDELIKNERYKQDETLDNMQLIQNRLIILKSSLVKKRGELLNLNVRQLALFFNESEESLKAIKHCNQLMPSFISSIHEKLMDNYLQRGHSKLMINGELSFCQNITGYIEQCSLNLFNFFDDKDDFILNMIITKQQSNNEIILFGIDGKILGFTKQFYEEILQKNLKMNLSHQNTKDQNELKITIKEFLNRNPLIQFYIPGITSQVQELRQQIVSSSNYLMNNLKSFWIIPNNHIECLQNSQLIFSQFKKRSYGSQQNFRSYKSQTYSRYSYNTMNTQFEMQYDSSEIQQELKSNISIDEIPILILHPEVEQQIQRLIDISDSQSKLPQTGVFYSLQFKTLNFKRGNYGYFMLTIKDFKTVANYTINGQQTSRTQPTLYQTLIPSQEFSVNNISKSHKSLLQEIISETPDSQYPVVQEIKQMNNNQKMNDSSVVDNSFKFQLKQSDRSNLFDSSRQPLFAKPKVFEMDVNDEVEQMEIDMQVIKEIKQEQIDEDQDEGEKKVQSLSQSRKKSSNILFKYQSKKITKNENDFASNPSRTSTNSTSKESSLIVQQLYHNTQLITPLKVISVLLITICSGILICNIINVDFISSNLLSQTNQLATLRQPQNINYFYTSEIIQEQHLILVKNKLITLSPFLYQRNLDTLQGTYDYARSTQIDLAIIVPRLSSEQGLNTTFETKFYQQNSTITIDYPLEQFYSVLYQNTETSYRLFINNGRIEFPQLMSQGVVRLNLQNMIDFHNQLIQTIIANTIDKQSQVKAYFLSVMFGEMFSIFLIIGIQLKYWLFIDHIVKSILFLVSRLNENQAFDQINRLQLIKEQLDNQINGNWKLFNFGDMMYGFSDQKAKKAILKTTLEVGQNSIKATSSLYSRIQRTYYLNRINVFISFIITILLTIYFMAGYLLHMSKNDNFQPSLTVTLKFVQFRHNMDSLTLLAGLIKIEPVIPNFDLQYINQTQACELLIKYRDNLSPLINEVAQVILENANANKITSRFDTILNYDLCLSSNSDSMPACDLSTIKLQYDQKDVYRSIISNGALGYTAALIKFINQEFDYEIQNLRYNSNETNIVTVQQQSFQNFILQYFTDIQAVMRQFLVLFQEDNLAIAEAIISVVQVYYYGVGTCLFLSYILLSIIWVYKQQMKIQSLRQILVLLPPDHILTTNVRSQAKNIHQMLY